MKTEKRTVILHVSELQLDQNLFNGNCPTEYASALDSFTLSLFSDEGTRTACTTPSMNTWQICSMASLYFCCFSITFQIIPDVLYTFLTSSDQWQHFHRRIFQVSFSVMTVKSECITVLVKLRFCLPCLSPYYLATVNFTLPAQLLIVIKYICNPAVCPSLSWIMTRHHKLCLLTIYPSSRSLKNIVVRK